eukprot:403352335
MANDKSQKNINQNLNMIKEQQNVAQKSWNLSFGGDQIVNTERNQQRKLVNTRHSNPQKYDPNQAFVINESTDVRQFQKLSKANVVKTHRDNINHDIFDQFDINLEQNVLEHQQEHIYDQDMFRHQATLNLRKRNSQRGRMKSEDLSSINIKKQIQYQKLQSNYRPANNNQPAIIYNEDLITDEQFSKKSNIIQDSESKLPSTLDVLRQHQNQFYQQKRQSSSAPKRYIRHSKNLSQFTVSNSKIISDQISSNIPTNQSKIGDSTVMSKKQLKFSPQLTQKTDILQSIQPREGSKSSRNQQQSMENINSQRTQDFIRQQQRLESISQKPYSDQNLHNQQQVFDNSMSKIQSKTSLSTTSLPQINKGSISRNNDSGQGLSQFQNSLKQSKYSSRKSNDLKIKAVSNNKQLEEPFYSYSQQSQNSQDDFQLTAQNQITQQKDSSHDLMTHSHLELSFGEGSPVRRQNSVSSQGDRVDNKINQDLDSVYQNFQNKRQGVNTSQKKKEKEIHSKPKHILPAQKIKFDFGLRQNELNLQHSEPTHKNSEDLSQIFSKIDLADTKQFKDQQDLAETSSFSKYDKVAQTSIELYNFDELSSQDQMINSQGNANQNNEMIYFNELMNENRSQQSSNQRRKLPVTNKKLKSLFGIPNRQRGSSQSLVDVNGFVNINNISNNQQIEQVAQIVSNLNHPIQVVNQTAVINGEGHSTSISKFLKGVEKNKMQLQQSPDESFKRLDTPTFLYRYRNNQTNISQTNATQRGSLNSQDSSSRLSPTKKQDIMTKVTQASSQARIFHSRNQSSSNIIGGGLNNPGGTNLTNLLPGKGQRLIFQSQYNYTINQENSQTASQDHQLTPQQKYELIDKILKKEKHQQNKTFTNATLHKRHNTHSINQAAQILESNMPICEKEDQIYEKVNQLTEQAALQNQGIPQTHRERVYQNLSINNATTQNQFTSRNSREIVYQHKTSNQEYNYEYEINFEPKITSQEGVLGQVKSQSRKVSVGQFIMEQKQQQKPHNKMIQ